MNEPGKEELGELELLEAALEGLTPEYDVPPLPKLNENSATYIVEIASSTLLLHTEAEREDLINAHLGRAKRRLFEEINPLCTACSLASVEADRFDNWDRDSSRWTISVKCTAPCPIGERKPRCVKSAPIYVRSTLKPRAKRTKKVAKQEEVAVFTPPNEHYGDW